MPGIVVFRRRWSVGSDDLVVPGLFLFAMHLIWLIALGVLVGFVRFDLAERCAKLLFVFVLIYMVLLGLNMINELGIAVVALRGSILDTAPRASMKYLLYIRLGLLLLETGWLVAGCVWLARYYPACPVDKAKQAVLGLIACNWCVIVSIVVTVWCTYDAAGRSWVKMKKYQRSMRASESKFQYKRSGSTRNWRQRKVLRAYQDSWHQRCRFLFCCMRPSDRNRNSFADIARLLSDFFRDLDVVPSDVVAGLVLLRKFQQIERKAIVEQRKDDTYEFLSGVAVTPRTRFLSLRNEGDDLELFRTVIRFAHFAVRAYGWPIYVMTQEMGACRICANLRCCCLRGGRCQSGTDVDAEVVEDNCCRCNFAALEKLCELGDVEIVYATYHVDVGETPFFVALDHDRRSVVVSIRGTLSMKDILTDLNAEGECLPVTPAREEWVGHKGMVQAAEYILDKLKAERLIERALSRAADKGAGDYRVVCVGHSLGAGTACILGVLLRQSYPDLLCYCYSPPGGLLSMSAVEYTKSFTISVVMGKDVVPRIGLHQMEALRADLINAIKRSVDPKWKTIACSVLCCGCRHEPTSAVEMSTGDASVAEYMRAKDTARCCKVHPQDSSIALTSHQPLYPPGRIIHVVRHHPAKGGEQALSSKEPVYQALWAENVDFDEVLISPVMIQDHMPDKVLDALNKVISTPGPQKPQRARRTIATPHVRLVPLETESAGCESYSKVMRETSFASLHSPSASASNASSSSANGCHSQLSVVSNRQSLFVRSGNKPSKKTMSLDLPSARPGLQIDLIHDDWFGLAPLASPESLSELSSISSRASLTPTTIGGIPRVGSFELKTPKVMRRTPKIDRNLSTCADDEKNVRHYQRLGQIARQPAEEQALLGWSNAHVTNSSGNLSYASACSNPAAHLLATSSDDFQSVEDVLDAVMRSAGCAEFFNSKRSFLETHFDEELETRLRRDARTPTPTNDADLLSNFAIDLTLDGEHKSRASYEIVGNIYESKANSVDSGGTPSDHAKNVTFDPRVIDIEELRAPQKSPKRCRRWHFMATTRKRDAPPPPPPPPPRADFRPKTILAGASKRRNSFDTSEEFFARSEALPLLAHLGAGSERTSPNFVRRKKYVYPTEVGYVGKANESSV